MPEDQEREKKPGMGLGGWLLVAAVAGLGLAAAYVLSRPASAGPTKQVATAIALTIDGQSISKISVQNGTTVKVAGKLTRTDTGAVVGDKTGRVLFGVNQEPVVFDGNGEFSFDVGTGGGTLPFGITQVSVVWDGDKTFAASASATITVVVYRVNGSCIITPTGPDTVTVSCSAHGDVPRLRADWGIDAQVVDFAAHVEGSDKDTGGHTIAKTNFEMVFLSSTGVEVARVPLCTDVPPDGVCGGGGPGPATKAASAYLMGVPTTLSLPAMLRNPMITFDIRNTGNFRRP